jgi:hypothetical protein
MTTRRYSALGVNIIVPSSIVFIRIDAGQYLLGYGIK